MPSPPPRKPRLADRLDGLRELAAAPPPPPPSPAATAAEPAGPMVYLNLRLAETLRARLVRLAAAESVRVGRTVSAQAVALRILEAGVPEAEAAEEEGKGRAHG